MRTLSTQQKSDIDRLWTEFWTGGITNPLTVIEQISFLMFARLLDVTETRNEKKSERTKKPFKRIFGPDQQHLRWSHFRQLGKGDEMLRVVRDEVFPHFRKLNGNTTFSEYMQDAQLMVQKASLLVSAVEKIDKLPIIEGDAKGDLYEYLLSKLTTAGINGQFRTPRHIIRFMVELVEPKRDEVIGDPACGTAGFLVCTMQYLLETYTSAKGKLKGEAGEVIYTGDQLEAYRDHIQNEMFHGFDFDATMLRIASMNLMLHGVENPDIHNQDTLSNSFPEKFPKQAEGGFDVILANPPFKGSLDSGDVHPRLTKKVKTKKTELLFVALILEMLKKGGRSATIVPAGVLEADSSAHRQLRKLLIEDNQLEGVIYLPHWIFKPYASVATAVLVFTRGGTTDAVWFYRLENDGFEDDASKTPKTETELPEILDLWRSRHTESYSPKRGKHRLVSRQEIVDADFDLSIGLHLRDYEYPAGMPLVHLGDIFNIEKGRVGAAQGDGGEYPLITSSEEYRRHSQWDFDGEAICIPLVSSTGHGHASIKRIHYVHGKFAAATIAAVLMRKPEQEVFVPYVYYYLLAHKDDLLVPLMRGAANVSLSTERLSRLRIPLPGGLKGISAQRKAVEDLLSADSRVARIANELDSANTERERALSRFRCGF